MRDSIVWATAAYFAAVVAASAQTASPPAAADPALIDKGKAAFAENCSHCHGPNMVTAGTVAPDLRTFPDDRARFFNTVKWARTTGCRRGETF
jgi:mono/diheme cytochrome c family protein